MNIIVVVGDYMIDEYITVRPRKISEEAPVLVVNNIGEENRLGGAGNVVANLKSLGAKPIAIGIVGEDKGSVLRKLLRNVTTQRYITELDRKTTVKTRIISKERQIIRIDNEDTNEIDSEEATVLLTPLSKLEFDAIVVSDYAKGAVTTKVMELLRSFDKPIIVNGKPEHLHRYRGVDILILNKKELATALHNVSTQMKPTPDEFDLVKSLGIKYLIVTLGSNGIKAFATESVTKVSGIEIEVEDVTGAGDIVTAMIVIEYIKSGDIKKAIELANIVAAKSIESFGTSVATPDMVDEYYKREEE